LGAFQQAAKGWRSLEIRDPVVASMLGGMDRKDGGVGGSAHEAVAVLWLSQPGVTAHAHFDKSHNFIVQVEAIFLKKRQACVYLTLLFKRLNA
jgi:hypothetical protein